MASRRRPGVFCIEGEWSSKLTDRSSMEPLLRALERLQVVQVVHRDAATRVEVEHYLDRWVQKQYNDFVLGYLAFHGSPGRIHLGRESMTLADLAGVLAGRCQGRILHFGSCSVLQTDEAELKRFLKGTGARAVCGYTEDIDWLQSAAFDFLLVDELVKSQHLGYALRRLLQTYPDLVRALGFRLVTPQGKGLVS